MFVVHANDFKNKTKTYRLNEESREWLCESLRYRRGTLVPVTGPVALVSFCAIAEEQDDATSYKRNTLNTQKNPNHESSKRLPGYLSCLEVRLLNPAK